MGCEQDPSIQFEEGSDMSARGENPFEADRIYSGSVCRIGRLEYDKGRHCVHRELESSVEKARAVWSGQDPAIANSGVPHAGILRTARNRVAAAGPHLEFMAALLGAVLGEGWESCQKHGEKQR